jgi:superoxide oxidase
VFIQSSPSTRKGDAMSAQAQSTPSTGTSPQWPLRVRVLHWIIFLAVAVTVCAILGREWIEDSDGKALMRIHTQAGVLVLLLATLRIVSRLAAARRSWVSGARAAGRAAALLHLCFYLILLALPLLGWAYFNARGKSVVFFGLELPRLLGRDRDLAETLESLHTTLGWTLLAMVGVHVLGALWHHFGAKDDVLRSMLLRKTAPSPAHAPVPTPHFDEVNE